MQRRDVLPGIAAERVQDMGSFVRVKGFIPIKGPEVGLCDQSLGTGRETAGQLSGGVMAQLPPFAEELKIQICCVPS